MEFFKELFLISEGLDLTMRVKRVKDKLTISILPDKADGVQPLIITGTWEELDKDFFTHVKQPLDVARVTVNNLESFKDQMKQLEETKKTELQKKAAPKVSAEKRSEERKKAAKPANKKKPAPKVSSVKENGVRGKAAESPVNADEDPRASAEQEEEQMTIC